jgi:hypothetical protein
MIVIFPTALIAQDAGRAMLHTDGGTWLNGNPAPNSGAIFSNDWIQNRTGNTAKIDMDGSTVTVEPDTIVQFEGDELDLDRGTLKLTTSRKLKVRVNCITVVPVSTEMTQYDVTAENGKAKVLAHKKDATIHSESGMVRTSKTAPSSDTIVHEGEQPTREEKCGAPLRSTDAPPAAKPILDTWWARGAGIAAVGGFLCFGLLCHGDDPISPSQP